MKKNESIGAARTNLACGHRRLAQVQSGALWRDVDRATQALGLGVTGRIVSETGVGGLTLGGAIGRLMRRRGLTVDNLVGADLVTADGRCITVDASDPAEGQACLRSPTF